MVDTVANIDAQIEWPEPLDELWPDITFLWLDGGLTAVQDFQEVSGLNVTLDTDIELVITGGADAHRFEVSDSGTTLKALEEFNFDDPQDGLIPGVLSVELGLRDGEGAVFDETRAYIVIRPDDTSGLPYQVLGQQLLDAIESNIADLLEIIGDWADATDGGGAAASQTVARSALWDPETWSDLWATLPQDNPQLYALVEPVWGPIQTTLAAWGDTDPSDLLDDLLDQVGISLEDVLDWLPETDDDFLSLLYINWLGRLPNEQSDGNDLLVSTSSGSTLAAGLGTDLFVSLPEDDQVVYDGARSDFVTDALAHGLVAVHKPSGESDLLVGVEQVVFDDGKLIFDIESDCVGLVYRLYQATFDRVPDLGGLIFWTEVADRLKEEWSLQEVKDFLSDQFVASQEFEDRFGVNPSAEDYVDGMYLHVLGRNADAEGKAWWVGGMEQGLGYDDILLAFSESDENVARTSDNLDNGIWVV